MNIKKLSSKLEQHNININLNEESLNYPVLTFNMESIEFKFFYRENFIKRSKFHKFYNTFFEITTNNKTESIVIANKIKEILFCRYCIDENKVYSNISKMSEEEIIDFIHKF
ncbi:hypothetical protein [Lutibacter sp.]|uniref:hypothetical protein n=1 Tax=Lutibacter sp. TaxID=1925666 RepID=UPI00349FE134